jgi:glycosyltransferase involved in cell wall biosynthesis
MSYDISVAISSIGRDSIFEVVKSIANQAYQPFEIVIYFDCDLVDTPSDVFIEKLNSLWNGNIHIYHGRVRVGAAAGYNFAISKCVGEIIAIASDDDIWLPTKLLRQIENYSPNRIILTSTLVLYRSRSYIRPKRVIPRNQNPTEFVLSKRTYPWRSRYYLPMSSLLFPRAVARIGFDTNLIFYEDYWWLFQVSAAGYHVIQLGEPLVICKTSTSRTTSRYIQGLEVFLETFASVGFLGRILKSQLPRPFILAGDVSRVLFLWKRSRTFETISILDIVEFSWQITLSCLIKILYVTPLKLFKTFKDT